MLERRVCSREPMAGGGEEEGGDERRQQGKGRESMSRGENPVFFVVYTCVYM